MRKETLYGFYQTTYLASHSPPVTTTSIKSLEVFFQTPFTPIIVE